MSSTAVRPACGWFIAPWLLLGLLSFAQPAQAARPDSTRLLPESATVYLAIADVPDLAGRVRQTAIGRILNDPELRPFVDQAWQELATAFAPLEERLGLSLGELLAIPQGEIMLAFVTPDDARPGVVLLVDVQRQESAVQQLLDELDNALRQQNNERSSEDVDGVSVVTYRAPNNRELSYFERDGALVMASRRTIVDQMLAAWNGQATGASLAENKKFGAVMQRCQGAADEAPQVRWFADPVRIFKTLTRDVEGAGLARTLLRPLGIEGISGIGGSVTVLTDQFDTISRTYLLLDTPRLGLVDMVALGGGDSAPEDWVPHDAASYLTLHYNVEPSYRKLATLLDSLRGAGSTVAELDRILTPAGLKFEDDVLPYLDDRFSMFTWVEKPVTLGSSSSLLGVHVNDPEKVRQVLARVVQQAGDRIQRDEYAGVTYYRMELTEGLRGRIRPETDPALTPPPPRPSFALVDNVVLIGDRPSVLEHALAARRDGRSLQGEVDFQLIYSKARRQVGGAAPSLVTFSRPEEGLDYLYSLAREESVRSMVDRRSADSRFFGSMQRVMQTKELPPFETLRKYLAPSGSVLINDDAGIYYVGFGLRRPE